MKTFFKHVFGGNTFLTFPEETPVSLWGYSIRPGKLVPDHQKKQFQSCLLEGPKWSRKATDSTSVLFPYTEKCGVSTESTTYKQDHFRQKNPNRGSSTLFGYPFYNPNDQLRTPIILRTCKLDLKHSRTTLSLYHPFSIY